MAATITQIRDGLKTRLATISGLEPLARITGGAIVAPAAVVTPGPGQFITYDPALKVQGAYDVVFRIQLVVSEAETESAQLLLDGYLSLTGSSSVIAAIEADRKLGNLVSDLSVEAAGNYGELVIGGTGYFGAEVYVTVMA
jgi:hypothetical protein